MEIEKLNNLTDFIKNAFEYYDSVKINYFKYINYKNKNQDIISDIQNSNDFKFEFNKKIQYAKYELLGIFDYDHHIWIWSWVLTHLPNNIIKLSKNLLEYGLKLDLYNLPEHLFIRSLLVNSRILIESFMDLDNNLAIISYLLKDRILFIYKKKVHFNNANFIYYYLITSLTN